MATIYNFSFCMAVYESKPDNISKTLTSFLHYHYHVSCLSLPSNLCIESIILHILSQYNMICPLGTVWQYWLWSFNYGNTKFEWPKNVFIILMDWWQALKKWEILTFSKSNFEIFWSKTCPKKKSWMNVFHFKLQFLLVLFISVMVKNFLSNPLDRQNIKYLKLNTK